MVEIQNALGRWRLLVAHHEQPAPPGPGVIFQPHPQARVARHHDVERAEHLEIPVQPLAFGGNWITADQHLQHARARLHQEVPAHIRLTCANTDRVNGWAEILHRLGDPNAGIAPRLFIHRRCARLLECLPTLQHDPNRPEDVLKVDADDEGVGGDDAADALRYLVATKAREVRTRKLAGV